MNECLFVPLFTFRSVSLAFCASQSHLLQASRAKEITQPTLSLLPVMLNALTSLSQSWLQKFISSLTLLAMWRPILLEPYFKPLLEFLAPLILRSTDSASTPTEANPLPSSGSFTFPPPSEGSKMPSGDDNEKADEEKEDMRKAALEFMITLSMEKPETVSSVDGWVSTIVRGCLEGMGTLPDDDLDEWLMADVCGCSLSLI